MNKLYSRLTNMIEKAQNQERIINYLREFGFKFVPYSTIIQLIDSLNLLDIDREPNMTFLIRNVRRNDWDSTLILGIKLNGKKRGKITVYFKQEHWRTIKMPWKDAADINFRKTINRVIFPDFMTYDERRKWRTEHGKVEKDPTRPKSEWYLKCLSGVKWINGGYK